MFSKIISPFMNTCKDSDMKQGKSSEFKLASVEIELQRILIRGSKGSGNNRVKNNTVSSTFGN